MKIAPPPAHAKPLSIDEQLKLWIKGESVHRIGEIDLVDDDGKIVETVPWNECTPDFSCCIPALQATLKIRRAFAMGDAKTQSKFLDGFLMAMIGHMLPDDASEVHLAGSTNPGATS